MMSVSNHSHVFASQISTALCVCLVWHSVKSRVAVKPQPSGLFNSLRQTQAQYTTHQLH